MQQSALKKARIGFQQSYKVFPYIFDISQFLAIVWGITPKSDLGQGIQIGGELSYFENIHTYAQSESSTFPAKSRKLLFCGRYVQNGCIQEKTGQ